MFNHLHKRNLSSGAQCTNPEYEPLGCWRPSYENLIWRFSWSVQTGKLVLTHIHVLWKF